MRKVDWYAQIGVPEYWSVDADSRTLERLVLDGPSHRIAQHAVGNVSFRPKSMRGLVLELGELWAVLD